jgi:hypothetical protein
MDEPSSPKQKPLKSTFRGFSDSPNILGTACLFGEASDARSLKLGGMCLFARYQLRVFDGVTLGDDTAVLVGFVHKLHGKTQFERSRSLRGINPGRMEMRLVGLCPAKSLRLKGE